MTLTSSPSTVSYLDEVKDRVRGMAAGMVITGFVIVAPTSTGVMVRGSLTNRSPVRYDGLDVSQTPEQNAFSNAMAVRVVEALNGAGIPPKRVETAAGGGWAISVVGLPRPTTGHRPIADFVIGLDGSIALSIDDDPATVPQVFGVDRVALAEAVDLAKGRLAA